MKLSYLITFFVSFLLSIHAGFSDVRINKTLELHKKVQRLDDLAFLRKVSLDCLGRVPTYSEILKYKNLKPEKRRRQWIDYCLNHSDFNKHWLVFYSDMLRIQDYKEGGRQLKSYIYHSVKNKKPYDEMVREMLTSHGEISKNPELGFILRDDADPMALAATVSQTFLGTRLACAQCHDHPYEDWSQKEFYQLASYFGHLNRQQNRFAKKIFIKENKKTKVKWPPENKSDGKERKLVKADFPFYHDKEHLLSVKKETVSKEVDIDALLDATSSLLDNKSSLKKKSSLSDVKKIKNESYSDRKDLAAFITSKNLSLFAHAYVNRVWKKMTSLGVVEPVDDFSEFNEPSNDKLLDVLAEIYYEGGQKIRPLIKAICESDFYQSSSDLSVTDEEDLQVLRREFKVPKHRRMISEVFYDSLVTVGHLSSYKWPAGANWIEREKRIKVYLDENYQPEEQMAMMTESGSMDSMKVDKLNEPMMMVAAQPETKEKVKKEKLPDELPGSMMAMQSSDELRSAQEKFEDEQRKIRLKTRQSYHYKTVTEEIDDNPLFNLSNKIRSPALPTHFMRVYGQTTRDALGMERSFNPSLRQMLIALNGKLTHEASRVGHHEVLYSLIEKGNADKVLERVYLETLTRRPNKDEVKAFHALMKEDKLSLLEAVQDTRWVILNSLEFRYIL